MVANAILRNMEMYSITALLVGFRRDPPWISVDIQRPNNTVLGLPSGLDITLAQQFLHMPDSIHGNHHSRVDQALLSKSHTSGETSPTCHSLVCRLWMVLFEGLCQVIMVVVHNFLWLGTDGSRDTRARVA